ncbi:MAG: isopentenyl phosphate kinase [Thermofilaceae archaeon]
MKAGSISEGRELVIVKLGGSLITDKEKPFTLRKDALEEASIKLAEIAKSIKLLIVHGGGSYGHYAVALSTGSQLNLITDVTYWMTLLNLEVIASMRKHGLPVVGLPTYAIARLDENGDCLLNVELVRAFLCMGVIPVTYGGLARKGESLAILSGDTLASELAIRLGASKLVFLMDVDGVYTLDPRADSRSSFIKNFTRDDLELVKQGSRGLDVTGGIGLKLKEALRAAEAGVKVTLGALDTLFEMVKGLEGHYTTVSPH